MAQSSRSRPRTKPRSAPRKVGSSNTEAGGPVALSRGEELLVAALDLFAERNFASVTIKDIANAIGVNTALIYYYFDSKEDLFRATIETAVERAFKHFRLLRERRSSPPQVIDGWLENHVALYDVICKLVMISLDYASTTRRSVNIDRSIRRFYDEEAEVISEAIRQGIAEGIFTRVEPAETAAFISTFLDGVMVRSVIFTDFDVRKAIDNLRVQVWGLLGYTPPPGSKPRRKRTG